MPVTTALCQCGCGNPAPIAKQTRRGNVRGEPLRFLMGHHIRGPRHHKWRGGRASSRGYETVAYPGHDRANPNGYVREHVLVAERVLGHPLPRGAQVHHINGVKSDNRPQNLVVCQDAAYHQTLHQRLNALRVCGHATWRKCKHCKQYDDVANLDIDRGSKSARHRECRNAWRRERGKQ